MVEVQEQPRLDRRGGRTRNTQFVIVIDESQKGATGRLAVGDDGNGDRIVRLDAADISL
ncbi:MAG: hypothetical protein NVS3B28_27920 [Candidatus Velthaea sp.]